MKYLTGIHALNLNCSLDTCGDWHTSSLKWENLTLRDSEKMFYKDYGIEPPVHIPNHTEKYFVANHIRALLDLIEEGNFTVAQGMNEEFICNPLYDEEIFFMVYKLYNNINWDKINGFMKKEYKTKWLKWLKERGK